MREQVVRLEDHRALCRSCPSRLPGVREVHAHVADLDDAGIGPLECVERAQNGVLPEPDGPIRTVTVPAATSKSIPRSTSSSPNDFFSPLTVTSGRGSPGVVLS